ncbi:MAG: hypothetical protein Q8L66_15135 [Caulobacter sp.]|nr:hypothetical protein [Caulobacter sp.]
MNRSLTLPWGSGIALAGLAVASLAPLTIAIMATAPSPAAAAERATGERQLVITVRDSAGRIVATTSPQNGKFTVTLPPGDYEFTLRLINNSEVDTAEPGIIAILIGLLLPAGRVEPISSEKFPLTASPSGGSGRGKAVFQDFHFSSHLPAPRAESSTTPVNGIGGTGGGRYTFKPGQAFTYSGTVRFEPR